MNQTIGLACILFVLNGCVHGYCRKQQSPTLAPTVADEVIAEKMDKSKKPAEPATLTRIMIFKYDGSQQCKPGSGVSVEKMAKELKGIQIYSSLKKSDGLMHIQVCGSMTGMANVYEISSENLTQAEKLGFKKWSFE